ncbi:MAG: phosphogluconate dehydratase [Cellvibrionaceae bacterium]
MNKVVKKVTQNIIDRSHSSRGQYLERMQKAVAKGVNRSSLSCGNLAHACAASSKQEKNIYTKDNGPNIGIVTAYNDMLSAHQPFEAFPNIIKKHSLELGATAQVAGGVPAMCDGVTQGQSGMELSLFSRDVIAMSAAVALSHQCFDAVIFLGVCDKIIPGLTIAAASFGHLPTIMMPAGPMPSGLPNEQKADVRQQYAMGRVNKKQLLVAEMGSYHKPGTCTFYGTANTNQLIMELMGLHLPGSSFINPNTPLREALIQYGVYELVQRVHGKTGFTPVYEILSEKNFVNAMVGLLASGGSTNLVIHLIAMARAAGIVIDIKDFADLSAVVPLISRVYPNGFADINDFQAAGGMPVFISELLKIDVLHRDVKSIVGSNLEDYLLSPVLNENEKLAWKETELESNAYEVLSPSKKPHSTTGGLVLLEGNLGRSVVKVSALKPEHMVIRAPCRIFHDQESLKQSFEAGELDCDLICVVRFQGPQANGMPELHGLTPILGAIQSKGYQVALVTDGRMSGASGKIPAAIHISPEASVGGAISRLRDGDVISFNANKGILVAEVDDLNERSIMAEDLSQSHIGCGRELFKNFRENVSASEDGASVFSF